MEDIKLIIAKNITDLRKKHGITQAELAEKLNYTDKAVSKWERGASVPDIAVLKDIAVLFSVTIDYLTEEEHNEPLPPPPVVTDKRRMRNFGFITGMSILLVVLIATFIFVSISFFSPHTPFRWIPFLYAVPVSMIVWLIFNSLWFNKRRNFVIISLLMWSVLCSVHITLQLFGFNTWLIYVLGIPGQAIIVMWSRLKFKM